MKTRKNDYQWLLFDADGTLFDFDATEERALRLSIEQAGETYERQHLERYRQINRELWHEFELGKINQDTLKIRRFELFQQTTGVNGSTEAFSQNYLSHLATGTELLEGAAELVQLLSQHYRMILITNGVKEVQRPRFSKSCVGHFFEAFIISGELGIAKPDSGIFDAAFVAMHSPQKHETLIIGDSLNSDIAGGRNYGIDTCWYNPEKHARPANSELTYEVHSLQELQWLLV